MPDVDKRPVDHPDSVEPPKKKRRSAGEALRAFKMTAALVAKQCANLDLKEDIGQLSDLSDAE